MTTKSLIKVEITNEISELNKYSYRNIMYTNKSCEKDICHGGDSTSLNR
jgi:hypothetical protein